MTLHRPIHGSTFVQRAQLPQRDTNDGRKVSVDALGGGWIVAFTRDEVGNCGRDFGHTVQDDGEEPGDDAFGSRILRADERNLPGRWCGDSRICVFIFLRNGVDRGVQLLVTLFRFHLSMIHRFAIFIHIYAVV